VLRLFKCRNIEGEWWLVADMRLRCYDGRWAGFAIYGLIMAVVYIVGLPAAVLWILWRRRHKLFGSSTDPFVASTRATFGFLYADYGSSAWWWEVEELLRKLLLSAVVVLIDEGSPLQVTLAVLVSGWAHVLHAQYKPWGAGSVLYSLQHGALFVTSFVFLMGLLFKVDGVSSSSGTYGALSGIMVTLCVGFVTAWVAVIVARVASAWRAARNSTRHGSAVPRRGVGDAAQSTSAPVGVAWQANGGVGGGSGGHSDALAQQQSRRDADAVSLSANAGDDVAASHSARGFVVENPLRRPARSNDDGSHAPPVPRAIPVSASVGGPLSLRLGDGEQSASAVASVAPLEPRRSEASTPAVPAAARLQRVLTAQRPVQSVREGEPSKADCDV
jgi:hypothetical protein